MPTAWRVRPLPARDDAHKLAHNTNCPQAESDGCRIAEGDGVTVLEPLRLDLSWGRAHFRRSPW
jgi:hypothetical protein